MSRMRLLILALICLGVASSFIPVYSIWVRMRAESLISNAGTLYRSLGSAPSISAAESLYKGELTQKGGCNPTDCVYEEVVSNGLLAVIHWAPYSELRSEIWFQDGMLKTTILDYTSSANPRHSVVSHVYIQDGVGPEFDLDRWEESSPEDTNGIVGVSPESLRLHEQTVLGFDTRCLTNHHGCASVAELLPTVWEKARDGKIRCRLSSREGLIEGPKWMWDALQ